MSSPHWPPANLPPWQSAGYIPPQSFFIPHCQPVSAMPMWYHPPVNSPTSPATNGPQSKYRSLNPILAEDTTTLRFDLKQKPSISIVSSTYFAHHPSVAFSRPTHRMRLISKSFPWAIDINSGGQLTVGDVLEAMHAALQEFIVESEWGFIVRDEKLKETVENAMKVRVAADPTADKRPKRIDFLGDATLFRGLEKGDDFARAVVLPGAKLWTETWIIKLTS